MVSGVWISCERLGAFVIIQPQAYMVNAYEARIMIQMVDQIIQRRAFANQK